ncbi:ribosomal family S4e-domain-containing protein [Mycena epipterygia]|nr:ribosomal family S4e-domain-containing protein [Mycena epipterygia]
MLDKLSSTYVSFRVFCMLRCRLKFLRNRLKYALTASQSSNRVDQIDNKVGTDPTFPAGFMDVISIEKSGEHFRLLYDVKGRFIVHHVTPKEATYKLLKVRKVAIGAGGVPHIVTADPSISVNDTVKYDLEQGKIVDFIKFDTSNMCIITGGRNMGLRRQTEHSLHPYLHVQRSQHLLSLAEAASHGYLPTGKGTKLTISEERDLTRKRAAEQ